MATNGTSQHAKYSIIKPSDLNSAFKLLDKLLVFFGPFAAIMMGLRGVYQIRGD